MAHKGTVSHAEMWDDSALVDSWNDALEEYKKYHSIKARGEDVDKILAETQKSSNSRGKEMDYEAGDLDEVPVNDSHAKQKLSEETGDHDTTSVEDHVRVRARLSVPEQEQASPSVRSPAPPQHLIGQVHDEGLKNLLMSYYYAGYYTGLYEAKDKHNAKHEA